MPGVCGQICAWLVSFVHSLLNNALLAAQLVNISGGDILTSLGLDADQLRDLIDVFRPLGATFNDFNAVFAAQTSASVEFNDLVLTIDRSLGDSGELGFSSLGELGFSS